MPGQISQSVQVVIGGTTVLSLSLSGYHPVGTSILYSGSLLAADGATTLFPGGQVEDSIPGDSIVNAHHVSLGFDEITPGLSAGFHEYENLGTGQKEYLILVNSFGATIFEVWVNLQVNSQDVITSGTARFTEGYETRTVACISGSLDSPVVTSNSGACTVEGTVPGAYSLGNLDDIKLTFQAFRAMHTAMKGLVEGVLSLVAVPTT